MLSKTDFLLFLESPMHLWAKTHDQLEGSTLSQHAQFIISQGEQIESLALEYFQTEILSSYHDPQLIWQPSYDDGQYSIRADALIFDRAENVYDLYEIKSSTKIKTEHEFDATFQALVLEELLNLRHIFIIHVDNTYEHGQDLALNQFFTVENVSEIVETRRDGVLVSRQEAVLVQGMAQPLAHFACTKPQSCPCLSLCHPNLPEKPVYNLPRIGKKAIQLRDSGVTAIADIPANYNLNLKQERHARAVKSGEPVIDPEAIGKSLAQLVFPLHFLDYETFNPGVPLFPGYHPYEHIVFQYSLFIINAPQEEPQHFECLITDGSDPAPQIVPDLLSHIYPEGSVIVWYKSFENARNKDLARHCPAFAEQLSGINNRLYDLMDIFNDGEYVHQDFNGSSSLKAVLPIVCPELSYADLPIGEGTQAMLTWYQLVKGEIPDEDRDQIEADMRDYCKMDTFGMVAILEQLHQITGGANGSE